MAYNLIQVFTKSWFQLTWPLDLQTYNPEFITYVTKRFAIISLSKTLAQILLDFYYPRL